MSDWINQIKIRLFRNDYGITNQPSVPNEVNVEHSALINAGDVLGPVIVEWMLAQKGINPHKDVGSTKHLMTVGSIISRGKSNVTVWGSGILKDMTYAKRLRRHRVLYRRKMDFRAVRGPLTRDLILSAGYDCPAVYGDPAILMPMIYQPGKYDETYPVSVIMHHRTAVVPPEEDDPAHYKIGISDALIQEHGIHFIRPDTADYRFFIDEICNSRLVISSSLHGLILAEAYGIPAIFLNWGMADQPTKFYDWYLSTGRELSCCATLEEALQAEVPAVPDLSALIQDLLDSFPYDLWEDSDA